MSTGSSNFAESKQFFSSSRNNPFRGFRFAFLCNFYLTVAGHGQMYRPAKQSRRQVKHPQVLWDEREVEKMERCPNQE
eukprot:5836423-Pyramimonas_sp.AAC.1